MSNKILDKVKQILAEEEKKDKPRFVFGDKDVNDNLLDADIYCGIIDAGVLDSPDTIERHKVVKKLKKPCILMLNTDNPVPAWYLEDFNIIHKIEFSNNDKMGFLKAFTEMVEKAADKEFIANALKKKEKGDE